VGKTSLIHRYVYDAFDDKYLSTIGAKITKKTCFVENAGTGKKTELTMLIWDIAGQKRYENMQRTYYRGAKGALVIADITRRETFENIVNWVTELFKVSPGVPVLVLANKYDLQDKAAISEQEIKQIIDKLGMTFLFTSAKSGVNVENAFNGLSEFLAQQ